MSRSETEWNDTTFVTLMPEPGLEPRGGFKKLRLQPPRELVVTAVQLCTRIYSTG